MMPHLCCSWSLDREGHVDVNIYSSILQPQSGTGTWLYWALYNHETNCKTFPPTHQPHMNPLMLKKKVLFFRTVVKSSFSLSVSIFLKPENCRISGYATSLPKAVEIGQRVNPTSQQGWEVDRQVGTHRHTAMSEILFQKENRDLLHQRSCINNIFNSASFQLRFLSECPMTFVAPGRTCWNCFAERCRR